MAIARCLASRGPAGDLDRERAGTQQIAEALPLLVVEDGVDASERLLHGVAQALGALHPAVTGLFYFGLIEHGLADSVGEGRDCAPLIDGGLSALGLQLVEDDRELRDLLLFQLELPREEAEGPANAEAAAVAVFMKRRTTPMPAAPGGAVREWAAAATTVMPRATVTPMRVL